MNVGKIYDWLIVFFIHEIPGLEQDYSEIILQQVQQEGFGKNNKIILLKDIFINEDNESIKFNLKLFFLESVNNTDFNFVEVKNEKTANPDKNSWKTCLKYIFDNFKSKRKILFTWSHGAAFGINVDDLPVNRAKAEASEFLSSYSIEMKNNSSNSGKNMIYKPKNYLIRNEEYINQILKTDKSKSPFFSEETMISHGLTSTSILKDNNGQTVLKVPRNLEICKNLEILWISDLAEVLNECIHTKIDMLIMTNCYIQLFENGYMLKDKVNYLIGPETYMYANGYDYKKIISLCNNNFTSTGKFLKIIIKDYVKLHRNLGNIDYLNNTSIFANSLQKDKLIFLLFDKIVNNLLKNYSKTSSELMNIRKNLIFEVSGSATYPLVDMKAWLKFLLTNLNKKMFIQNFHFRLLLSLLSKRAKAKQIGIDFINNDKKRGKIYGFSGASLYYPIKKDMLIPLRFSLCAYFDNKITSIFKRDSHWDEFIEKTAD